MEYCTKVNNYETIGINCHVSCKKNNINCFLNSRALLQNGNMGSYWLLKKNPTNQKCLLMKKFMNMEMNCLSTMFQKDVT